MSLAAASRTLLATATGNWVSRTYLAIAAALLVWAYVDAAFIAQADSSFAGVYAIMVTAPASLVLLTIGAFSQLPFSLIIMVCALLNAWLIGLGAQRIAARRRRDG
ncbi:SCO4225 family membrane protein [Streptomyces sp. NPDC001675]